MARGQLRRQFFIAVFPPQWVNEQLAAMIADGPQEWRWQRPDDFHISLAFTGTMTDAELKKLITVLRDFEFRAFPLSLKGQAVFPREPEDRRSKKHVLWAWPDTDGDNALRTLHNRLAHFLKQRGFRYGLRRITPHLTLAKTDGPLEPMEAFAAANSETAIPAWSCDRIELRESLPGNHPEHPNNNGGQGGRFKKITEIKAAPA